MFHKVFSASSFQIKLSHLYKSESKTPMHFTEYTFIYPVFAFLPAKVKNIMLQSCPPLAFQTLVQFLFQISINPLCKCSCSTFRCQVSNLHFASRTFKIFKITDQFLHKLFPSSIEGKKTHPSSILKSVATCQWIKPSNTIPRVSATWCSWFQGSLWL